MMDDLIKPLSLKDWEGMNLDAEAALLEMNPENQIQLANHIFALSNEVRRLRLTYGEPVWFGVNTTKEQDEAERAKYSSSKDKK